MTDTLSRKIITGIFLVLSAFAMSGVLLAASASVRVSAKAHPAKVTLGDEIRLIILVEYPRTFSVLPPGTQSVLLPFEIKDISTSPFKEEANRMKTTFVMRLTVFELGEHKIPPVTIPYIDAEGRRAVALTEPIPIKVVSVGKKQTDKEDIRPIKGPVSLDLRVLYTLLCGVAAFFLALWLVLKVWLRLRKKALEDLESTKAPHERAFLELERLRKMQFLENARYREYYNGLSDILRKYLERRFLVKALEFTTTELLKALKQKDFDARLFERIKTVLENADLVKFAKFTPSRSMAAEHEKQFIEFVEWTKPTEEPQKK